MRRYVSHYVLLVFFANTIGSFPLAQAQVALPESGEFRLPAPGVRVNLSPEYNPPILKGIKVRPDNPFRFDFILDRGDDVLSEQGQLKSDAARLIKYFLASLTIPEKDLWVNLSPYEKNRIVPESFGQTEMGRDLLAEDYMLKQITASLIYPEGETGKRFWKRVYEEAQKRFGTTNIPVNTFNKVWIVPEKAVVYENTKAGTAYVVESKLKVMLEQDYLALEKNQAKGTDTNSAVRPILGQELVSVPNSIQVNPLTPSKDINALGSQIVREIVIPELTKEVNEGKNFSKLRQVYNALILATWYKQKIKDSILTQVYENKNKVAGVNINNPLEKQEIYERYLQAFKKGVYNYIKDETDLVSQKTVPRKYFSGGMGFAGRINGVMSEVAYIDPAQLSRKGLVDVSANLALPVLQDNDVSWADKGRNPADMAMTEEADNKVYIALRNWEHLFHDIRTPFSTLNGQAELGAISGSFFSSVLVERGLKPNDPLILELQRQLASMDESENLVMNKWTPKVQMILALFKAESKDSTDRLETIRSNIKIARRVFTNIKNDVLKMRTDQPVDSQLAGYYERLGSYDLKKSENMRKAAQRIDAAKKSLIAFVKSVNNDGSVRAKKEEVEISDFMLTTFGQIGSEGALLGDDTREFHVTENGQNAVILLKVGKNVGRMNMAKQQLQRVITNLINNSLDAKIGVHIDVSVERLTGLEQDQMEIIIRDNGPGIPPDVLRKIKAGNKITTKPRGNGIGLGSCRYILKKEFNAEFMVNSNPKMGGTMIKILIPTPALVPQKDEAMQVSPTNGGIDLSLIKMLTVQNNGKSINFQIDPVMLARLRNASGFTPVIINIQPMLDLSQFLGVAKNLPAVITKL